MLKKIISIALALTLICLLFVGCKNDAPEPQTTNQAQTTSEPTDQTTPAAPTESVSVDDTEITSQLTPVELDLYGTINEDSQYVAAIAHNGNIESSDYDFAKKTYIGVYDIGEALQETNMLTDEWCKAATINNFLYNMGLGNERGAFICVINNNNFEDGSADYAPIDSVDKNGVSLLKAGEYTVISKTQKDYTNDYIIHTDDWEVSWYEKTESRVYMKIGETDEYNIYILTTLNNAFTIDDQTVESVNQAIANNDFKHSVVVLNNSDDLSSIEKVWGQEHDLSQVSFLQDILATKLSNMYGLNLKTKDTELHLDNRYLTYRTYNEQGKKVEVTFDYFPGASAYSSFDTTYDDFARFCEEWQKFSYTDADGNEYEYFADGNFYIYKNQELMGIAKVSGADLFDGISAIFGIKP